MLASYRGPLDPGNIQPEAESTLRAALELAPKCLPREPMWAAVLGGDERLGFESLNRDQVLLWNSDNLTYSTQRVSIRALRDNLAVALPIFVEDLRRARRQLPRKEAVE